MPISVKLSLLPQEAEALRDYTLACAKLRAEHQKAARPVEDLPEPTSHLDRALTYLHGALAHQIARYVPEGPTGPKLRAR